MNNSRRDFIKKTTATGAALLAAPLVFGSAEGTKPQKAKDAVVPFKLKYAPSIGMFQEHAGKEIADNIRFCNDMGFRAMFDNGLMSRPPAEQEKIAGELQKYGMDLGPFVLYADFPVTSFVLNKDEIREMLVKKMKVLRLLNGLAPNGLLLFPDITMRGCTGIIRLLMSLII